MIRFFLFLLLTTSIFASLVQRDRLEKGTTYITFLEKNKLPSKTLYYNLDKDDQVLTEEIKAGVHYQISKDSNGSIEQILLPLNDELQIHIYKSKDSYAFEAIPIISDTKIEIFSTTITLSPNYNILKDTGSKKLAQIFVEGFKHSLNFKNGIQKGDRLVMIYEQKYRLNQPFSMPNLKSAMIEMNGKRHFIYLNKDERYYDENAHEVEGFLLASPVLGARLSSRFSKRRWHPVLHKWKAHLGIDYAARSGTPVRAAGSGRVRYSARMGSYGNLIKLSHADGYETRYAHLKSFKRGIRQGQKVKKGQVIGYVGTTGRSTGPHLHFELRKNGRAINPLSVVQITTKKLAGKSKTEFLKLKEEYDKQIDLQLKSNTPFVRPAKFQTVSYFDKRS